MRSDVIHISSEGTGIDEAVKQAEAVAVYKSLPKKDSIHLLLLTEEMMGMMTGLTGKHDADFWLETEGGDFRLHLKTETKMNTELRKKLLSASTSGENIAAKGVMGKIKDVFSRLLEPTEAPIPKEYAAGFESSNLSMAEAAAVAKGMSGAGMGVWSLNRYRAHMKASGEAWDELEQSIVANIADEVEIGIADNSVEMIIYKKF
ncbi:MAG: hypothetical protein K6C36_05840 [Clostridia bacterium]|nr:hypothetical protein [Clostridia bacterium]